VKVLSRHSGPETLHLHEWSALITMSTNKDHAAATRAFWTGRHFVFRYMISKIDGVDPCYGFHYQGGVEKFHCTAARNHPPNISYTYRSHSQSFEW
jgi:hypothetical protein